jgi:NADPH-dependent curcumin reductase CurA
MGGAGGIGSILIQLARRLTGLTVVATATRPDREMKCRPRRSRRDRSRKADEGADRS